jgi:23S rRNA (adenine2503-C2)-methyltransferase
LAKKLKNMKINKSVNVVFMGMGEPLDNLLDVKKAIQIMSDEKGLAIHPKRITVSTSGIPGKIEELANAGLGVNLAISLHAVDDATRSKLVPLNRAYNIEKVLEAVRLFPSDARKKTMFEYLLLGGINDDERSAKILVRLLNGIDAKVNLIHFNAHEGSEFRRSSDEKAANFAKILLNKDIICTIRTSRGEDIDAACGQLRHKALS